MTNRLALLFLVVLSAMGVTFGQGNSRDDAELRRMLNEFLAGAGSSDAAVHDRFWADDLIYTGSSGTRIGKAELMKGVRSAPAPKPDAAATVYTAEDVRVQQYGDTAVVAFRLVAAAKKSDGTSESARYLNTGTFVKRRGEWRAVAWQATAMPKPKE